MHATVPSYTFARLLLTLGLLLVLAAPIFADAAAGAWPHLRGPGLDGRVTTDGVFDQQGLGLELAWKTELGPAYSGVSIADGTAVTFYSDGDSDLAVALDADDGRVSWTYRIDSVYRGHDGSSDGPLSSPVMGTRRRTHPPAPRPGRPPCRMTLLRMRSTPFWSCLSFGRATSSRCSRICETLVRSMLEG